MNATREHVRCFACGRRRLGASPHPAICPSCGTIDPWVSSAPAIAKNGNERIADAATAPIESLGDSQSTPARARGAAEQPDSGLSVIDLHSVNASEPVRFSSGYPSADLVLGGGFAVGRVVLLQSKRGTGKSRMLTRVAAHVRGLWVDVEEDHEDAKLRWLGVASDLSPPDFAQPRSRGLDAIDEIEATMRRGKWPLVVVNSFQGVAGEETRTQGEAASRLSAIARSTQTALVLVSQMNAAGEARGSKQIEQWVDTIAELRRLRPKSPLVRLSILDKNRGGPTDLVAWFRHEPRAFREVEAPAEEIVDDEPAEALSTAVDRARPNHRRRSQVRH